MKTETKREVKRAIGTELPTIRIVLQISGQAWNV